MVLYSVAPSHVFGVLIRGDFGQILRSRVVMFSWVLYESYVPVHYSSIAYGIALGYYVGGTDENHIRMDGCSIEALES